VPMNTTWRSTRPDAAIVDLILIVAIISWLTNNESIVLAPLRVPSLLLDDATSHYSHISLMATTRHSHNPLTYFYPQCRWRLLHLPYQRHWRHL
jgi:hypothetical protein